MTMREKCVTCDREIVYKGSNLTGRYYNADDDDLHSCPPRAPATDTPAERDESSWNALGWLRSIVEFDEALHRPTATLGIHLLRGVLDRLTAAEDALAAAREDTKMLDHLDTLASGITINGDRDFPSMSMTPKEPGFSHTRRLIEMDMLRRAAPGTP